jgi:hypothetical protein
MVNREGNHKPQTINDKPYAKKLFKNRVAESLEKQGFFSYQYIRLVSWPGLLHSHVSFYPARIKL